MKGQVFTAGCRVRMSKSGDSASGLLGEVKAVVDRGVRCAALIVRLDDGTSVFTCACYADLVAPPDVSAEWCAVTKWESCSWRPHLDDLEPSTIAKIHSLVMSRSIKRSIKNRDGK